MNDINTDDLAEALSHLTPDQQRALMERTGMQPSTQGFSMETLSTILQTVGKDTAIALKRAGQRENPNFPDRSVFNPRGRFDDEGRAQPPKLTFKYDTYFIGVLIGRAGMTDDLSTEEEIALYNRFDKDYDAHKGKWTARLAKRGDRMGLFIDVPHQFNDDRMGLPPLTSILLTLLEGEESINPVNMLETIKKLTAQVASLQAKSDSWTPEMTAAVAEAQTPQEDATPVGVTLEASQAP